MKKHMQSQLLLGDDIYKVVLDSLPEIVIYADFDGNIKFANQNALKTFGYTQDDIDIGVKIFQLIIFSEVESAKERIETLKKGKKLGAIEYLAQRKDGSTFPIMVYPTPVFYKNIPVGLVGMAIDFSEQRRLKENIHHYISEITKAQEEERKRIAREIHDDIVPSLASLSLDLDNVCDKEPLTERTSKRLKNIRADIDNTIDALRHFSRELRPEILEQFGLLPALELIIKEQITDHNVNCFIQVLGDERRISPEIELALFRITQEALHNAKKHSDAKNIIITIEFTPKIVKLNISDNGKGFIIPKLLTDCARQGKLGLVGMRERARLINSAFKINSHLGKGTTISVNVKGDNITM